MKEQKRNAFLFLFIGVQNRQSRGRPETLEWSKVGGLMYRILEVKPQKVIQEKMSAILKDSSQCI